MSSIRFSINKYQITLGADLPSIQTDMDAKIIGIIGCYGNGYQLIVNFVEGSNLPAAKYDEDKKTGAIYIAASMLNSYVDILRNEKPLTAYCNSEHPEWSNIQTDHEMVGEGER